MKKFNQKTQEPERPVYILCPRCEINYIDKKEKYCAVCKAEMGMGDPSIFLPDEEEEEVDRVCPVCHINLLGEDEEICFECRKEREDQEKQTSEVSEDEDNPGDWEPFVDDEDEEIPDGMQEEMLGEEEEEEEDEFEDVEEVSDEPDDFDFNVDPNDFVDDDEEEDEDDDL